MKTIEELRKGFEEIPTVKLMLSKNKYIYFRLGFYWCDTCARTDGYIAGMWEMYQELNK